MSSARERLIELLRVHRGELSWATIIVPLVEACAEVAGEENDGDDNGHATNAIRACLREVRR